MTIYIPRRAGRDIAAEYREKAKNQVAALSGRGRFDMTTTMNQAILKHIGSCDNFRVLDIGCGDADLLRRLPPTAVGVGTLLTQDEVNSLKKLDLPSNISVRVASFDTLETIPGPFDIVIANGCLQFALTKTSGLRVLRQIVSKLASGGKLWAGELLSKRTYRRERTFQSRREAIEHVRQKYGWRFAAIFALHILKRRHRSEEIVECAPDLWFVQPHEISAIADSLGLKVEGIWSCVEITGEPYFDEHNRFSALLSKQRF